MLRLAVITKQIHIRTYMPVVNWSFLFWEGLTKRIIYNCKPIIIRAKRRCTVMVQGIKLEATTIEPNQAWKANKTRLINEITTSFLFLYFQRTQRNTIKNRRVPKIRTKNISVQSKKHDQANDLTRSQRKEYHGCSRPDYNTIKTISQISM